MLKSKQYDKIDIQKLFEDLGYNGYSLHYERHFDANGKEIEQIYYPKIKRELIKQSYLKPLLAKHLGCKPSEIFVGKYFGNGKNIKYVIGDLLSPYLAKDCKIEKVFGSVNIKNYQGDFPKVFSMPATHKFSIKGDGCAKIDTSMFNNFTHINNQNEWREICQDGEFCRE